MTPIPCTNQAPVRPADPRPSVRRRWSTALPALLLLALLLSSLTAGAGVTVAAPAAPTQPVLVPLVQTADSLCSDWEGCITTLTDGLRKLWVVVIIAEVIAAFTYFVFFFLGTWFPSLMQPFGGDWVKKAVLIGVLAHPVLLALIGAIDSAKDGLGS